MEIEQLIYRHLKQISTPEEERLLNEWLTQSPGNQRMLDTFRFLWTSDLRSSIALDLANEREELLLKVRAVTRKEKRRQLYLYGLAASLTLVAVVCGLLTFFFFKERSIEYTKALERTLLPDSSSVILNENSKLSFYESPSSRKVTLEGEAFLEIHPDHSRPLFIYAQDAIIKVVGTSLTVRAYEGKRFGVTVISGTVEVKIKDKTIVVAKSQCLSWEEDQEVIEPMPASKNAQSWHTRSLEFDGTPLNQVLADLEATYDVEFSGLPPELVDCRFTASFDQVEVQTILDMIAFTFHTSVVQETDGYRFQGGDCQSP